MLWKASTMPQLENPTLPTSGPTTVMMQKLRAQTSSVISYSSLPINLEAHGMVTSITLLQFVMGTQATHELPRTPGGPDRWLSR